jgi:two-component system, OmpR family, sensor histidine kinase BaeS
LKLSIGHRLFATVLLSTFVVGLVGLELVRWKLLENSATHSVDNTANPGLDVLAASLSAQYERHAGWSFLPADSAQRKIWLREQLRHLRSDQDAKLDTKPSSWKWNLEYRIGLVDQNRHYLAGVIANPIIVAFASIDRTAHPVTVNKEAVGYLIVAKPQNPEDSLAVAFLMDQQGNLALISVVCVLLSALATALLAGHFRKAIHQLVAGAHALESGRLGARLVVQRSDELGELAEAFNRLAERLDAAEGSRRQWVANTSHELRTPLSVLRSQIESLRDGIRLATPENIALMLRQVHSLTKLVDELYVLARTDVAQLPYDPVVCEICSEIWPLVCEVSDSFAEKFRAAGLQVTLQATLQATTRVPPPRSTVLCDTEQIRRVITNLLENSVRYTAAGGRVEVSGTVSGDELQIAIDDSSPGVPDPLLVRLGERFFRVEPSRNRQLGGSGLGLALCKQILDLHGGRLTFAQSPLGGLRAVVVLPLENHWRI